MTRKGRFSIFMILVFLITMLVPFGAATADEHGDNGDNGGYPTHGSLTIHKFEQDPLGENPDGDGSELEDPPAGDALPGVVYELTKTHAYNPGTGIGDESWNAIPADDQVALPQVTTNSNGIAYFPNLELGRYMVEEVDGPPHVDLNPDEYYVDIPMTSADGSSLNFNVHIYPKNQTIRGAVSLEKIDGVTEDGLQGVEFELYKVVEDGDDEKINGTYTTNADGMLYASGLAYGDYYFLETDPKDGYVGTGDTKHFFKIEASGNADNDTGTVVPVVVENFLMPEIDKLVEDEKTHYTNREVEFEYTVELTLPGDIQSYEEFIITDTLDADLTYVTGSANEPDGFTFDRDGNVLEWKVTDFSELENGGTVTLSYKAMINADGDMDYEGIPNTANLDFENGHGVTGQLDSSATVYPTAGDIVIDKFDGADGAKLEGAVFKLKDADGNEVDTKTTNANGYASFEDLPLGTYYLEETAAPSGYRLLMQDIEVVLDENGETVTVRIANSQQDWELPETGGMGTLWFTLLGLVLMGGAAGMFMTRRRQTAE